MKGQEFSYIERYFRPLITGDMYGGRDDAAMVSGLSGTMAVATDSIIEGVHFSSSLSAEGIARKALRVNLSDMAAMGVMAQHYLVALMVPQGTPESWFRDFAEGLATDQKLYGVSLLGGDMAGGSSKIHVAMTMFGMAQAGVLSRSNAQRGDDVYVSGTLGDAALGLRIDDKDVVSCLSKEDKHMLAMRLHRPSPRMALGQMLVGVAHSCIDISDGLVADLTHICEESQLGMVISRDSVPLSSPVRKALEEDESLYHLALCGGDDYELAFTAPAHQRETIMGWALEAGAHDITHIGYVEARTEHCVRVVDSDGHPYPCSYHGYRHF
ncbi:MAG: thiamine-phosphate kinase [Alphaproteobacteria bacterium GM7ARS4]|nr:thiamine-phosphate kinase [Alphaproteobacteria bacterium GM7ARS4]